jgi:hypothetical protein
MLLAAIGSGYPLQVLKPFRFGFMAFRALRFYPCPIVLRTGFGAYGIALVLFTRNFIES